MCILLDMLTKKLNENEWTKRRSEGNFKILSLNFKDDNRTSSVFQRLKEYFCLHDMCLTNYRDSILLLCILVEDKPDIHTDTLMYPCIYFFFFFFFLRNTHTKEREWGFNTKAHHKIYSKAIVIFKGGWGKLYYTQHSLKQFARASCITLAYT